MFYTTRLLGASPYVLPSLPKVRAGPAITYPGTADDGTGTQVAVRTVLGYYLGVQVGHESTVGMAWA